MGNRIDIGRCNINMYLVINLSLLFDFITLLFFRLTYRNVLAFIYFYVPNQIKGEKKRERRVHFDTLTEKIIR